MTTDAQATPSAADRKKLSEMFEAMLRENREIDAGDRDALLRYFEEALDAPGAAAPADADAIRKSLAETLDLAQRGQAIDSKEREVVSEQFEQQLQALEDEALQRALEFGRRVQRDGEAKAREWLASQAQGASSPPSDIPPHVARSLRPGP